jgi:hypothetical protein
MLSGVARTITGFAQRTALSTDNYLRAPRSQLIFRRSDQR